MGVDLVVGELIWRDHVRCIARTILPVRYAQGSYGTSAIRATRSVIASALAAASAAEAEEAA